MAEWSKSAFAELDEVSALRAEVARLREVADKCSTFFRVSMPKMNISASWLDAEAIEAWNEAALVVEAHDRAALEARND